jgi:hypothetical protein
MSQNVWATILPFGPVTLIFYWPNQIFSGKLKLALISRTAEESRETVGQNIDMSLDILQENTILLSFRYTCNTSGRVLVSPLVLDTHHFFFFTKNALVGLKTLWLGFNQNCIQGFPCFPKTKSSKNQKPCIMCIKNK